MRLKARRKFDLLDSIPGSDLFTEDDTVACHTSEGDIVVFLELFIFPDKLVMLLVGHCGQQLGLKELIRDRSIY